MVFGTMRKSLGGYAYLIAADINTGAFIWGTSLDAHVGATITQSPTIYKGAVYGGVSSLEEAVANDPDYTCCTFRGSMVKVGLAAGNILWQTFTTPDNGGNPGGFSGVAVWGSSPSLDPEGQLVYYATGNNYEVPQGLTDCLAALGPLTASNVPEQLACEEEFGKTNYRNSILALNMQTGKVRWATKLGGPDAWNVACLGFPGGSTTNCPDVSGPDYDFGQAPMIVTACNKDKKKPKDCKKTVVAGQKSGWVWSLRAETGKLEWSKQVGPGGVGGGHQWGSAADDSHIYVTNNNYEFKTIDLTGLKAVPNTPGSTTPPTTTMGGIASALDPYTGDIIWTFANPALCPVEICPSVTPAGPQARTQGPMTVNNGVVYYGSLDSKGILWYLDAASGALLGSFKTGASIGGGASVARGKVFIGSGYANFFNGVAGNKAFALKLPDV